MEHEETPTSDTGDHNRREFLRKCGKFAAVTPPAVTMLLSTSLTSDAIAKSGSVKFKGNNGWGNGGKDGTNKGSSKGSKAQSAAKGADKYR